MKDQIKKIEDATSVALKNLANKMSAMFPVIGATVMGVVHGLLFIFYPAVIPLIISHLAFFIFTIV